MVWLLTSLISSSSRLTTVSYYQSIALSSTPHPQVKRRSRATTNYNYENAYPNHKLEKCSNKTPSSVIFTDACITKMKKAGGHWLDGSVWLRTVYLITCVQPTEDCDLGGAGSSSDAGRSPSMRQLSASVEDKFQILSVPSAVRGQVSVMKIK